MPCFRTHNSTSCQQAHLVQEHPLRAVLRRSKGAATTTTPGGDAPAAATSERDVQLLARPCFAAAARPLEESARGGGAPAHGHLQAAQQGPARSHCEDVLKRPGYNSTHRERLEEHSKVCCHIGALAARTRGTACLLFGTVCPMAGSYSTNGTLFKRRRTS